MSKTKEFIKNSGIYFAGKVLTLLVTIFLIPLFTNHVSTTDYGNYELVRTFVNLLIPFLCAECWKAIFRLAFTPRFKSNKETLFGTSLYFCLISDVVISLALFFVLTSYNINPLLPIILVFTETVSFLYQHISRSLNKNFIFALSGIIASLVNVLVGVICIFVFNDLKNAMFLALIGSQFAQILIIFFSVKGWRYFNFKFVSFDTFKKIIVFAWPFGLTTLVYFFSNGFNNILIKTFLDNGVEKVAIYAIALKFIAVVTLFASVIEMAWADVLYKIEDEKERKAYINKWLATGFKVFCVSGLLMLFIIKLLFPVLVGSDYSDAWELMPVLYLSTFFLMANNMLLNPCRAENKSWIFLVCKTANAIVSVGLFFLLFRRYDLMAVCISTTIGMIIEYIVYQILDKKILKINLQILPAILFCVFYIIFAFFIFKYSLAACSVLFLVLVVLSYFYLRKDLDELTNQRFAFLKKASISKPNLFYLGLSFIIYQSVFFYIYYVKLETTVLSILGFVGILLLSAFLLVIISKKFNIEQSFKKKYCFWLFLLNLMIFGFILLILNEFYTLVFINKSYSFILVALILLNMYFIEITLGDIHAKVS